MIHDVELNCLIYSNRTFSVHYMHEVILNDNIYENFKILGHF